MILERRNNNCKIVSPLYFTEFFHSPYPIHVMVKINGISVAVKVYETYD